MTLILVLLAMVDRNPCDLGYHSSESVGLWHTDCLELAAGVTVCIEGYFLETLTGVLYCAKGTLKV